MWYAMAAAMDGHRDYSDDPKLIESLQKTAELVPDNLAVIGKLIEKQALGLTRQRSDGRRLP